MFCEWNAPLSDLGSQVAFETIVVRADILAGEKRFGRYLLRSFAFER